MSKSIQVEHLDAWPILPRRETEIWSVAKTLCSELAEAIKKALHEHGIRALVHTSAPGQLPMWVQLVGWAPTSADQRHYRWDYRVSLTLSPRIHPYREDPIRFDINWESPSAGGRKQKGKIENCENLTAAKASDMALFVFGRSENPLGHEIEYRGLLALFASFIPFFPAPGENKLRDEYKSGITWPTILSIVGIVCVIVGFNFWPMLLVGISCFIISAIIQSRRRLSVAVIYRPDFEPRRPRLIDTWHAVVTVPAAEVSTVRTRIFEAIRGKAIDGMTSDVESYGYFGPDGYVERNQLVVKLRQALVYIHIYGFKDELFIGWDSSLNLARWGETATVSRRIQGRDVVEFKELGVAAHTPNEYDLIDVNVISELVHRRLRDEIRRVLEEHEIEEEIDFSVTRGAREAVLRAEPNKDKVEKIRRVKRVE